MKPKFKKEASSNEEITFFLQNAEKIPWNPESLAMWTIFPLSPIFMWGSLKNQVQNHKLMFLKKN